MAMELLDTEVAPLTLSGATRVLTKGPIYPSAFIFLNSSVSTGTTLNMSPTMP
jgi:hypothetical protein